MKLGNLIAILLSFQSWVLCQTDYFKYLHNEMDHPPEGQERHYYIAIDEVIWDYLGDRNDLHTEVPETSSSSRWMVPSDSTIGSRYYKALYREYTNDTYTTLVPRKSWQGNMGPIIRAQVGDTIFIHLWNRASNNYTIHPHGVMYPFEMEGAVYEGASEHSPVQPNERFTYTWMASPRAGPGPADGDAIVWGYHSHVTENDIYAGLYGAILIYKPGKLTPQAVNDDIVMTFFGLDENLSPYLSRTLNELAPQVSVADLDTTTNIKQCINGLMLSDPTDLVLNAEQPSRWHLLGWGSIFDILYVDWKEADVSLNGQPTSRLRLLPATFKTITVTPHKAGKWLFGYVDSEQGSQGMSMYYHVQ